MLGLDFSLPMATGTSSRSNPASVKHADVKLLMRMLQMPGIAALSIKQVNKLIAAGLDVLKEWKSYCIDVPANRKALINYIGVDVDVDALEHKAQNIARGCAASDFQAPDVSRNPNIKKVTFRATCLLVSQGAASGAAVFPSGFSTLQKHEVAARLLLDIVASTQENSNGSFGRLLGAEEEEQPRSNKRRRVDDFEKVGSNYGAMIGVSGAPKLPHDETIEAAGTKAKLADLETDHTQLMADASALMYGVRGLKELFAPLDEERAAYLATVFQAAGSHHLEEVAQLICSSKIAAEDDAARIAELEATISTLRLGGGAVSLQEDLDMERGRIIELEVAVRLADFERDAAVERTAAVGDSAEFAEMRVVIRSLESRLKKADKMPGEEEVAGLQLKLAKQWSAKNALLNLQKLEKEGWKKEKAALEERVRQLEARQKEAD